MFEEMLRELRRLEGAKEVAVPVAPDHKGHFDRECPSSECLFQFKVHGDDWRDKVRNEEVFCPFCGHAADAGKWWTYEQVEHARESAVAHIAASAAPWNRMPTTGTGVSPATASSESPWR